MPTKIQWADETINPLQDVIKGKSGRGYHCTKVSPGCDHCYAESMNKRFGNGLPFDGRKAEFEVVQKEIEKPLHWKKPRRIFVQSMGDLFHPDIPNCYIDQIFVVMAACPQHTFIVLTKRPENIDKKLYGFDPDCPARELGGGDYLPNVWLGVTCENQEQADKRIPILLQIPAAVHFVSHEPALGDITYPPEFLALGNRAWLINGGETGHGARPMHLDIPRHDRDQCQAAGVPYFFKQWGQWKEDDFFAVLHSGETPKRVWVHSQTGEVFDHAYPYNCAGMIRVGKKAAGRLLDGRTWEEYPKCPTT